MFLDDIDTSEGVNSVKKKKKKKSQNKYSQSDLGGQTIFKDEDGKLYRLPDMEEIIIEERAKSPSGVRLRYTSLLEKYFHNHVLYPDNPRLNEDMYKAGCLFGFDNYKAGLNQKVTMVYEKDFIKGDLLTGRIAKYDAHQRVKDAMIMLNECASVVYDFIVHDRPSTHYIKKLQRGLLRLCNFYDI